MGNLAAEKHVCCIALKYCHNKSTRVVNAQNDFLFLLRADLFKFIVHSEMKIYVFLQENVVCDALLL